MNNFLRKWVTFIERFPLFVLLLIAVLTAFASFYTSQHFSINSDLDRLIKPTKIVPWYQQDRDYRASFPQYQQKALVVVSGDSAEATFLAAEKLYKAMRASKKFAEVFAPEFDQFAQEHALYGAPTEGVRYVSDSIKTALPRMAPVYQQPTISHFMQMMQLTFNDSADMEVLTPENRHQLEALTNGIESLTHQQSIDLAMVKRLLPQDDGKISYHFISVKDFEDYSIDMPYKVTMKKIHDVIKEANIDDKVKVRITGEVPLENNQLVEAMDGAKLAGGISTVLIILLLVVGIGYGKHSLILNAGMFLTLGIGIIWTTYLSLLVVGGFSTLSIIFLVMFFGLGVDFAIHYILCVEHFIYDVPPTDESPCVKAAVDKGIPLILSALSSVIAFLSFTPTSYVGMAELGMVSAIGMSVALVATLTVIPAWLKLLGITERKYEQRRLTGIGEKFGHFFSQKLSFAPMTILLAMVVLAAGSLYYARDIRFNYSHLAMRNAHSEAMKTLLELQHNGMVTDYSIAVMVDPKTSLDKFKQQLLALPSVERVELPGDKIPLFQNIKQQIMLPVAAQLNGLGEKGAVSTTIDIAASQLAINAFADDIANKKAVFLDDDLILVNRLQKALNTLATHSELYPTFQAAIGAGISADMAMLRLWFNAQPFSLATLPDDVKSWFIDKNGRLLINVIPKLDMSKIAEMDQFIAEVQSVSPNTSGRTVIEWGVGKMVIESFTEAATITILAIFILLWINFRKISTVLLVFTPLILTTIFMFAIMKMIGLSLNMANILVVPMIYGLGVDMGIHVVDEYYKCNNVEDLVVSYTTRSVVLAALTTVSSFVAMSLSPDKGSASIGILLSVSMLLLLAVTYIVLPALLHIFQTKKVN